MARITAIWVVKASRLQKPLPHSRVIWPMPWPSMPMAMSTVSSVSGMANTKGSGRYLRISSVKKEANLFMLLPARYGGSCSRLRRAGQPRTRCGAGAPPVRVKGNASAALAAVGPRHQLAQRGALVALDLLAAFGGPGVEALAALGADLAAGHFFRQQGRGRGAVFQVGVKIGGDGVVHVDAVHVALFQRARQRQADAEAPFDDFVDVFGAGDAFFEQRDGFARQGVLDAVGDEAGDVALDQHGALADAAQHRHHALDGRGRGVVVAHDLDQRDDVGGGEEVGADEAVAPRDG